MIIQCWCSLATHMTLRILDVALIFLSIPNGVVRASDRRCQTGTWVDAGITRTPFVGAASETTSETARPGKTVMSEVVTYVIETDVARLELRDVVAIGAGSLDIRVGSPVTFAVNKKTAYIGRADGTEYRLMITKKTPRHK